jgi:predicted short-subunit dehydrogenase-like oxidoreductase (DUF2520 family)
VVTASHLKAYRQFVDGEESDVRLWPDDPRREPPGTAATDHDQAMSDPLGVGRHRHGDSIHAHLEPHPHERGDEASPTVGIVGAGAVGTALGVAISRSGWPVRAVASRDQARRDRFVSLVPGARAFIDAVGVVDEVELVILAVPDDAVAAVVEPLRLYGGQSMIHTSGLLGEDVLEPARAAGSQVGTFHPLVSFTSDVERSVAGLAGATIALEGDDRLVGLLADLAEAFGGLPVRLPAGSKPAYHAAAVLASGGLVALLDAIVALAATAGIDEPGSLAIYGRLLEQTLANARAGGVAQALTGPIVRGDAGTLAAHLATLDRIAPGVLGLYVALARRELAIAEGRRVLTPEQAERVRAALAKVG